MAALLQNGKQQQRHQQPALLLPQSAAGHRPAQRAPYVAAGQALALPLA